MTKPFILLTGGGGFLGHYLQSELLSREYPFTVPPHEMYDLRTDGDVVQMLEEWTPHTIIHAAASVGGIGANQIHPAEYFYDNMAMGLNLIHRAALAGVKRFVCIGTVCAYPKFAPVPFTEDTLWDGYPEETNAPYGVAKRALWTMGDAYQRQHGMQFRYIMPTNLYGPRDNFDLTTSHVIPAIIRKIDAALQAKTDSVELWGKGSATRDFLYVTDAATGIISAMEKWDDSTPLNLGSGYEISIHDLAWMIAELMGYSGFIMWNSDKPDGQPRRRLDISHAKARIGFEPSVKLIDGLTKTIEWYRAHHEK